MKLGLCHKNVLKTRNHGDLMHLCVTSGYFPFYNDDYGHVRYDDDGDHAAHDTQGFVDLQTLLQTTSSTMMGLGGCDRLEIHARTCGSCVGKYCTSNLV